MPNVRASLIARRTFGYAVVRYRTGVLQHTHREAFKKSNVSFHSASSEHVGLHMDGVV